MAFDLFINFNGNCREALTFYEQAFRSKIQDMMTYDQAPPDPNYQMAEADKGLICYACVPICGCNVMFCDVPSGSEYVVGNNLSPTVSLSDKDEIGRLFDALSEGGEVGMPLEKTFWSELYGMVTDRFGVIWQLSYAPEG